MTLCVCMYIINVCNYSYDAMTTKNTNHIFLSYKYDPGVGSRLLPYLSCVDYITIQTDALVTKEHLADFEVVLWNQK